MNKKIGVIASSAGSVIFEIYPYLLKMGIDLVIATDRECGIEKKCIDNNVTYQRFSYDNAKKFSKNVRLFFKDQNVDNTALLYYTRFVSEDIYNNFLTLNFHPSLLPLFPGLNPIQQQLESNVQLLGATLHKVDASCDAGEILGQISNSFSIENINKTSFLQKVFLTLAAIDIYMKDSQKILKSSQFLNTNLPLSKEALLFFQYIEKKHNMKILGL